MSQDVFRVEYYYRFFLFPCSWTAILRFAVKKQTPVAPGVAAGFSHRFREPAALVRAGLKCNASVVDIAWLLCLRRVISQSAESEGGYNGIRHLCKDWGHQR